MTFIPQKWDPQYMWIFCFVTMYHGDHLPKLRLKDCQESAKGINAQIKQSYVSHHLIFGYLRT